MAIDKETVASKLHELYVDESDPQYGEFFDWAAKSQRYRWETTLEKIQNTFGEGDKEDAKTVAMKMVEIGAGEFKKGVRGRKGHVAWAFRLDSVGRVARGDKGAELIEPGGEESGWGDTSPEYVTHTFVLRPDDTVQITVPADITINEAEKLGDFVKLLSFQSPEY